MLIERSFNNSTSDWKYSEQDNWRIKQGNFIDSNFKMNRIPKHSKLMKSEIMFEIFNILIIKTI